jgi:hypothetical protein
VKVRGVGGIAPFDLNPVLAPPSPFRFNATLHVTEAPGWFRYPLRVSAAVLCGFRRVGGGFRPPFAFGSAPRRALSIVRVDGPRLAVEGIVALSGVPGAPPPVGPQAIAFGTGRKTIVTIVAIVPLRGFPRVFGGFG